MLFKNTSFDLLHDWEIGVLKLLGRRLPAIMTSLWANVAGDKSMARPQLICSACVASI